MSQLYRGLGFMVVVFAVGAVFIKAQAQTSLHLSDTEALAVAAGCFAAMCIGWDELIDSNSKLIMEIGHWGWLTALVIVGGYGLHYYSQHPDALRADADKVRTFVERPVTPPPSGDRPADPAASTSTGPASPSPAVEASSPPAPEPVAAAAAPAAASPPAPAPRQLRTPVRFNCAKRWYGVDYVICSDADLLDGEAGLEQAYDDRRATITDEAGKKQLGRAQFAWSKQFGQDCGLPAIGAPANITPQAVQCVGQALIARTSYLLGLVAPPSGAPSADAPTPTSDASSAPAGASGAQSANQPSAHAETADSGTSTEDQDPIEVDKQATNAQGTEFLFFPYPWVIHIKAKTGSITLHNLSINRGNCKIWTLNAESKALKFGDAYDVWTGCDPIEAIVSTDKGDFKFTW